MADVAQHLKAGRSDVYLGSGNAEGAHQAVGVGKRRMARCKAGHCVTEDVLTRQSETVHGLGRDDQRLRRVKSAGDSNDDPLDSGALQPLHQAMHLYVVGLETASVARRRVARNVWEAFDPANQRYFPFGYPESEADAPHLPHSFSGAADRVVEARHAHAVLGEALEVNVGDDDLLFGREAIRLGQQIVVLVNDGVAVPGEVGGRFARTRRRIEVGRDASS